MTARERGHGQEEPEGSAAPEVGSLCWLDLWDDVGPFRSWAGLAPRFRRLADEALPVPAVDVDETDEAYVVTAENPGIDKGDVNVECHDGMLTIHGEKRSEEKEKRRWTERYYGSFSRSFRLPSDADENAIEARFKDGVLTVTVGRSRERKPRVVAIKG